MIVMLVVILIISFSINGTLEITGIAAIFAAVNPAALWGRPSAEIAHYSFALIVIWGQ